MNNKLYYDNQKNDPDKFVIFFQESNLKYYNTRVDDWVYSGIHVIKDINKLVRIMEYEQTIL